MAADKIRPAAIPSRLTSGWSLVKDSDSITFVTACDVSGQQGKDVKTIQGLLRHAKATTTLDLYSQAIDAAKLEAQEDIALAIRGSAAGD